MATVNNYCRKDCPYLLSTYNVCCLPVFKNAKILKFDKNGRYFCICDKYRNKRQKRDNDASESSLSKQESKKKKYSEKKVEANGILYDSVLEYKRHLILMMYEKEGRITSLKYHVSFTLIEKTYYGGPICYEADFVYKDKEGNLIVEDTKSPATKTRLYKLKKRLMAERYGIVIKEVTSADER